MAGWPPLRIAATRAYSKSFLIFRSYAQFVERFGRPFGGSVNPSMLIVREDAPKTFLTGRGRVQL